MALTDKQRLAIVAMLEEGNPIAADAAERCWTSGKRYSRTDLSEYVKGLVEQANADVDKPVQDLGPSGLTAEQEAIVLALKIEGKWYTAVRVENAWRAGQPAVLSRGLRVPPALRRRFEAANLEMKGGQSGEV